MSIKSNLENIKSTLSDDVTLVCVSKYHTEEEIMEAYNEGVRDFGENKVQDMVKKAENLPKDIRWHLIGHLQTNKVKYIVGKTYLVQSVDRIELAEEINKRFEKENLVQVERANKEAFAQVCELQNRIDSLKARMKPLVATMRVTAVILQEKEKIDD